MLKIIPLLLLGAFDYGVWEERHLVVGVGDALVFYTDGVTDTRGEDGELFGQDRLSELLDGAAALDADEVASRIVEALQAFERGQQRDDVALLVLRTASKRLARRESAGHAQPSFGQ